MVLFDEPVVSEKKEEDGTEPRATIHDFGHGRHRVREKPNDLPTAKR